MVKKLGNALCLQKTPQGNNYKHMHVSVCARVCLCVCMCVFEAKAKTKWKSESCSLFRSARQQVLLRHSTNFHTSFGVIERS